MIRWILCLILGHCWQEAGVGLPESSYPNQEYYVCARCRNDSRPSWMIEDELLCKVERIELKLRRK